MPCNLLFPISILFSALELARNHMFVCAMKDCKTIKARNSRGNLHFYDSRACELCVPARETHVDLLIFATPSEARMSIKTFISIANSGSQLVLLGVFAGDNDFLVGYDSMKKER